MQPPLAVSNLHPELTSWEGQGVVYTDCLPLKWVPATAISPLATHAIDETNLRILKAITALEERGAVEPEPSEGQDLELRRVHDKLDAALDLMAQLLVLQRPLPSARGVQISHRRLSWSQPAQGFEAGDDEVGCVQIHLHRCLVQPLQLVGRVREVVRAGDTVQIEFELAPLSEAMATSWDRHVFRHHRRAIAEARRGEAAAS